MSSIQRIRKTEPKTVIVILFIFRALTFVTLRLK